MKMFDEGIIADPYRYLHNVEEPEIWVRGSPKYADHIRVSRGLYYHHGIYVSDNEVIHFTGKEEDDILGTHNEVIKTDLQFFLKDGTLEIKEYTSEEERDLYPPDAIVSYARACIGDTGYNLIFNNCEHFANVCTLGRHRSGQVENVFQPRLPGIPGRERDMFGWIGKIGRALFGSNSGGSRSSSTTTYEPDKVKIAEINKEVAEIEAKSKRDLKLLDMETMEKWRDAQKDLIRSKAEADELIVQAQARGYMAIAQATAALQQELTKVAKERLQVIEQGSAPMVKEMEDFYRELEGRINNDVVEYLSDKLPILHNLLKQYEKGSESYESYKNAIDMETARRISGADEEIKAMRRRQENIQNAFLKDKEQLIGQTSMITEKMLASVNGKLMELGVGKVDMSSLTGNQLPQGSRPMELEEGKGNGK